VIVNHEKKYVFISIAKTASTSIRRRLGYNDDPPPEIYHMFLKDIIKEQPKAKDYFKFAFVRNPYDRLYSTYINLKYDGHDWATHLKKKSTFREFVLDFKQSEYCNYIHLQPQSSYIKCDENIAVDFLGKYEALNEHFKIVENILKLPNKKLIKLRSASVVPEEPKFYDEGMKQIVRDIYKEDFERFGYVK
tara:strand:- start:187 stop:759 length:573 start_codon:yes stop_codon:yes gene_type:complete